VWAAPNRTTFSAVRPSRRGVAAHLAVLHEAALDVPLEVHVHALSAVGTGDDEILFHVGAQWELRRVLARTGQRHARRDTSVVARAAAKLPRS
jgi:hypothetical protein